MEVGDTSLLCMFRFGLIPGASMCETRRWRRDRIRDGTLDEEVFGWRISASCVQGKLAASFLVICTILSVVVAIPKKAIASNSDICWTRLHDAAHLDMDLTAHPTERQFNPYTDNGGSILAIAGADFAVVASDTRQSEGYSIQTRYAPKVFRLYASLPVIIHPF